MLTHDNTVKTGEDENTTKEMISARVGKTTFTMTIVTHHKDGKTIVYRRQKRAANRPFSPFDVTRMNLEERTTLGLTLMSEGWDVTQVAVFVGMPIQAFRRAQKKTS